jgi:hypothetical protein
LMGQNRRRPWQERHAARMKLVERARTDRLDPVSASLCSSIIGTFRGSLVGKAPTPQRVVGLPAVARAWGATAHRRRLCVCDDPCNSVGGARSRSLFPFCRARRCGGGGFLVARVPGLVDEPASGKD